MRFGGQVVLVTGASSGIGAALARELAREGAHLVLFARRADRLDALRTELESSGTEVLVQVGDVTRRADLDAAVAATMERFGRLDMAIANAGFGVVGPVAKLAVEDYRRQFETNVFGVLETVGAALPELRKSRGRLVLIGSVAGHISMPSSSPYSMSKFAVRALALAMQPEERAHGVSVTLISPGFIESEIRQVDNRGVRHDSAKERLPAWIVMPTAVAARKIVTAAYRRRREAIITVHGKIFVWLQRFAPWVLRLAVSRGARGRAEPRRTDPGA